MDFKFKPDAVDSQSETMDLLSRAWCNFAVHEAFQTELQERSLVLHDSSIKLFDNEPKSPSMVSTLDYIGSGAKFYVAILLHTSILLYVQKNSQTSENNTDLCTSHPSWTLPQM